MAEKIEIFKLSDLHAHLRRAAMLEAVAKFSAEQCFYVLVMPNSVPGIYTGEDVVDYRAEILQALGGAATNLVMSIYITPETTAQDIYDACAAGARNGKIYPKNLTTNSQDGFTPADYVAKGEVYGAMAKCGMVLSLHGELPGQRIHALDRERRFLYLVKWIAENYPDLKIVLEHITTAAAVRFIEKAGTNVGATITLHHLMIFFNDVVEPKLHGHLFCKPLAKRHSDMQALARAALSGSPKFFLGSDTAPHLRSAKECADCCAGVWTAPVLAPALFKFFRDHRALDKMPGFATFFGPAFYGLKPPDEMIELVEDDWQVPMIYPVPGCENDGIVPFWAGQTLPYRMA